MPNANKYRGYDAVGKTFTNELCSEYTIEGVTHGYRSLHFHKNPHGWNTNLRACSPRSTDTIVDYVHKNQLYPHLAHVEKDAVRGALESIANGESRDAEVVESESPPAAVTDAAAQLEKLATDTTSQLQTEVVHKGTPITAAERKAAEAFPRDNEEKGGEAKTLGPEILPTGRAHSDRSMHYQNANTNTNTSDRFSYLDFPTMSTAHPASNGTSKQRSDAALKREMYRHMFSDLRDNTDPTITIKGGLPTPGMGLPPRKFEMCTYGPRTVVEPPPTRPPPPSTTEAAEGAKSVVDKAANKELAATVEKNKVTSASLGLSKDVDLAILMRRVSSLESANQDMAKSIAERDITIDSKLEHARDRTEEAVKDLRGASGEIFKEGTIDSISQAVGLKAAEMMVEKFKKETGSLEKCTEMLTDVTSEQNNKFKSLRDDTDWLIDHMNELSSAFERLERELNKVNVGQATLVSKDLVDEQVTDLREELVKVRSKLAVALSSHDNTFKHVERHFAGLVNSFHARTTSYQAEAKQLRTSHKKLFEQLKTFSHEQAAGLEELKTKLVSEVAKLKGEIDDKAVMQHALVRDLKSEIEENRTLVYDAKDALRSTFPRDLKRLKKEILDITGHLEIRHNGLGEEFESFRADITDDVVALQDKLSVTDNKAAERRCSGEAAQRAIIASEADARFQACLKTLKATADAQRHGNDFSLEKRGDKHESSGTIAVEDTDEDFDEFDELKAASQCGSDFSIVEEGFA